MPRDENPNGGWTVWRELFTGRNRSESYQVTVSVHAIPDGQPPTVILERATLTPRGEFRIFPTDRIALPLPNWQAAVTAVQQEVRRYDRLAETTSAPTPEAQGEATTRDGAISAPEGDPHARR